MIRFNDAIVFKISTIKTILKNISAHSLGRTKFEVYRTKFFNYVCEYVITTYNNFNGILNC